MGDPFDLQRFVAAQEPVFGEVCAELRAGRKRSHWMWFIFPQLRGLGSSAMAERFGISSLPEALAYLRHPVLGARLRECAQLALDAPAGEAEEIFGPVDAVKLRSSLTLFCRAAPEEPVFRAALDRYFGGQPDALTLDRL